MGEPMLVSMIVAMDDQGGIAKGGRLPWHLSTDLIRFKSLTMGHHLVMGRKTYESIGSPLAGRVNVVVTRSRNYDCPGCLVAHSLDEALDLAWQAGEQEVFVIGGGEIYTQALPLTQRIYLTRVAVEVGADIFFPTLDPGEWVEVSRESYGASEHDEYGHTFAILERDILRPSQVK